MLQQRWRFGYVIGLGRITAEGDDQVVHGPVGAWYHSEVVAVEDQSLAR